MSNFQRLTQHPKTGIEELATWNDGFYGKHRYGVFFPSDESMWREEEITNILNK